jgi:lipoprotein-anchoring transpeptidase ErfK/SrfK
VRRKSLISTSLCLAGFCALLLGASGCAGGDDDATIGTPSAAVQGLVDPSAPPAVNLPETQPDTIAPAGTAAMAAPRPVAAAPMMAAPPPPAARVLTPVPDVEPPLSDAQVQADATEIQQAMARAIPHQIHLSAARQEALISLAQQMAADDHLFIRRPQLVLIVDRASSAQLMALTLARPDGDWEILGTSDVSTGKPGRKQHFKTPVGVLLNDGSELGYRAQGTYNQNHIRGLGVKGMRVWDFGWQTSDDWRTPGATMQVRVEMHATDPAVLEQRLGRADSEGCIRLPDALNRFLDRRGIIDADLERLGETDAGYHALLSPYLAPTPIAGDSVIVVDSSETWVKPYPPETDIALSD